MGVRLRLHSERIGHVFGATGRRCPPRLVPALVPICLLGDWAVHRLPTVLLAASTALLGWGLSPLIGTPEYRPVGIILGLVGAGVAMVADTRPVRARFGWLPARSQVGKVYNDVHKLRSALRVKYVAREVVRSDWDWQISELETGMWKRLERALPDDWRALHRASDHFANLNDEVYQDDNRWASRMLTLMNNWMASLRDEMDKLPR